MVIDSQTLLVSVLDPSLSTGLIGEWSAREPGDLEVLGLRPVGGSNFF